MKKSYVFWSIFVLMILLSGCATTQREPRFVWPPPPEDPRLEWKGVYYSDADFARVGTQKTIGDFLGRNPGDLFKTPFGVVSNGKGVVYVSDIHWKNVWIYDFNSRETGFLSDLASFASPLGLALDQQDNLYVADGEKGKVLVFDKNRIPLRTIGEEEILTKPAYLAINNALGRLYVSDSMAHRIVVFDLNGRHKFSFGERGQENGQFFAPQGMAIAPNGDLFVVDMFNARIQVFDADGTFKYTFGERGDEPGQLEAPKDIAFDSDGNLYVIESRRSNMEIYSPDGKLLLVLGDNRATQSQFGFSAPRSISIDSKDQIFVAEAVGRRLSAWQYFGADYKKLNPFTEADKMRLIEYVEKIKQERQ